MHFRVLCKDVSSITACWWYEGGREREKLTSKKTKQQRGRGPKRDIQERREQKGVRKVFSAFPLCVTVKRRLMTEVSNLLAMIGHLMVREICVHTLLSLFSAFSPLKVMEYFTVKCYTRGPFLYALHVYVCSRWNRFPFINSAPDNLVVSILQFLRWKASRSLHLLWLRFIFIREKRAACGQNSTSSLWTDTAEHFILDLKGLLCDFQLLNNQPQWKHYTLGRGESVFPKLSGSSSRWSVNLKGAAKAKIEAVRFSRLCQVVLLKQ